MYKIKVFFLTVWRFLTLNPVISITSACALGVAAAIVASVITVNRVKSSDVAAEISSLVSAVSSAPVVETVPEQPPIQPVEKQVTYKGKKINVAKAEVAKPNSNEDAQNGNYKTEPSDITPGTVSIKPQGAYCSGIDVSSHNGDIDWARVKAAGVQFAMIRCGYRGYLTGKIVTDAKFDYNIQNAYKNGIDVGIYFYSTATNATEGLEEAAYVVERIKECVAKGISFSYPIAYDFEEFYNTDDRSRAKTLSAEQISVNSSAFLDYIKSCGYTPMLYAGKNAIRDHWTPGMASKYYFWLAHYTEATEYEGKFFMWQYTSKGSVDGIAGRVDLDVCGFDESDNLPQFLVCKNAGVTAYSKPEPGAPAVLTLSTDTVYLSRNTFSGDFKEIKISGKYYYVPVGDLMKIPFVNNEISYKTSEKVYLYSQPYDDTYKTAITLPADTPVKVTGVWLDKWAKLDYEGKVYYVPLSRLADAKATSETDSSGDDSSETDSSGDTSGSDSSKDESSGESGLSDTSPGSSSDTTTGS